MCLLVCRLAVDIAILVCYIGIGGVYVVFIAGVIQECLDSDKRIGQSYYALIIFPLLFLMNMAKNLAEIAPISIAGNVFIVSAAVIGMVYSLKDGISDEWFVLAPNVGLYPKFFGVVFFCMCSPGLVSLNLRNDQKIIGFF